MLRVLPTCPIGQVARLSRTLNARREEYLAYFDTDGVSNGPTEAMNLLIEKQRRIGQLRQLPAPAAAAALRSRLAYSPHAKDQKPLTRLVA